MKLVKQAHLIQDRGSSQRVYEIDLCEVGADQYVVNFRYGRVGRRMQEGSLTTLPVDRANAERQYRKLVQEKIKSGYYDPQAPQPAPKRKRGPRADVPKEESAIKRKIAILARLRGGDSMYPEWPLNRAIWRAGELGIEEAESSILDVLQNRRSDPLRRYVAIWALGRCGSQACVQAVRERYLDQGETPANRRIAGEALLQILPDEDRQALIAEQLERLPKALAAMAHQGPAAAFSTELDSLAASDQQAYFDAVSIAYLANSAHTRPAVISFCQTASVDSDDFYVLRSLYKAAEYRCDGQVFGLLAHKFEIAAPASRSGRRRFSPKTKNYYRWRTWRTLRRLGEQEHADTIRMAVGVLVPFSPEDGPQGHFGSFWAFNHLLYHNSRVYQPDKTQSTFVRSDSTRLLGQSAFDEEAFPHLWDKAPTALLHLLDESELPQVHTFAVRALKRNVDFLSKIDLQAICMLLLRPVEATAAFGLELLEKRYDANTVEADLFLALADSIHKPARELAWRFIDRHRIELIKDTSFLAALAFCQHQDSRLYLKNVIKSSNLSDEVAGVLVGKLLARLLEVDLGSKERIADVSALLLRTLSSHTGKLGLEVIADLFESTEPLLLELAGELILANPILSHRVPSDMLFALLSGPNESVRAVGVALLNGLAQSDLAQRPELFFNLVTSSHRDLRAAARPLIASLAAANPEFCASLGATLEERLRYKDEDDLHGLLRELLQNELSSYCKGLGKKEVLRLLNSRFVEAQQLGCALLEPNVDPADLSLAELIRLADHDFQKVRLMAWSFCEGSLSLLKQDMNRSVCLLDASWDDSRAFMFRLFDDKFDKTSLTPAILVSICDSVRADVQQFGRGLITRYFEDENGPEYLLKLSEHPSVDLQLFVTNYLQRYATDHLERIASLSPYFISVLSRVNMGRVAKSRVLRFLETEALKSRPAAEAIAPILSRQSVTMAIENKALIIEAMCRIRAQYPDIELPLVPLPIPFRSKTEAPHAV